MVVDLQLVRSRAQRGKHRVEQHRVGREAELQARVVADVVFFLAGLERKSQQDEYE